MADYNISAEITADASGFESGVKKAQKASKNLSKTISGVINGLGKNGLVGALGAVGLASQGLSSTLGSVIKIARKVSQAVGECTQAYKNQIIAERELNTAIENNPFVTGASAKSLKQFASEMQKVTNYGDEQLLPMMANLISLGRTETETMNIMSVALDMSAGMGISLDTAITQLNATLNGSIGRLGQQNAELKNLTEEELKQGKAIEILGNKFKGFASTTADTSKQLQNIKGDFKEALGQFTLPSSDMWNKFWAGFYERGIKIINQFNDYLDANIIGKNISKQMTSNADIVAKAQGVSREDVLSDLRYLKEQLKQLNDEELKAYTNYLSNLKQRTQAEERQLTISKQILQSRGLQEVQAKKEAEAEAQRTKEKEKQAEIEKENAKTREEQAQNSQKWDDKLLAQRIEMLEKEKEKAIQNAEDIGEDTLSIYEDYNEKILELKLEQIRRERDEALSEENLTEEERAKIIEYYANKEKIVADEITKYKRKKNKEEEKDEESKLAKMVKLARQYAKKISEVFKKVANTIKNIFSSVVNIFSKMFDFNIDDALDNLLKVEDAILTFFVETLPRLPSFMASVVYSIKTLLKTVKKVLQGIDLKGVITAVLSELSNNLPEMVSDLLDILVLLVDGAVDGLVMWVTNGNGLQVLLELILKIQTTIERLVTDNIDKIVTMLEGQIDNIANFIANSMASANRTLPKIVQAILRLIKVLIDVIAKAFENDDFVNSIVDSLIGVIDEIINILPKLITSIVKLIFAIINALIPKLPEIISKVVTEIGKILSTDTGEILKAMTDGIAGLLQKVFTLDFWISLLSSFGEALGQIISSAFSGIGKVITGGSSGGTTTGSTAGDVALGFATGGISTLGHAFGWWAKGTNNAPKGLSIVGEAGPELVRFNGGEQVLNNRNTNKALEGMGGKSIINNVTFNNLQDTTAYAMMNQFKAYNRQLAINGVI